MTDFRILKTNKDEIIIRITNDASSTSSSNYFEYSSSAQNNSSNNNGNQENSAKTINDKGEVIKNLPAVIESNKTDTKAKNKNISINNNSAFLAQYASQINNLKSKNHLGSLSPHKARVKYTKLKNNYAVEKAQSLCENFTA